MATNGIDFVIGGKDEASPAIDEVEKSMDKLLDQQIEYDRIQQKVAKSTTVATSAIQKQEKAESSLETKTSKLNMAVGALVVAYGAIKAATALLGGLDKINAAYDQQTASVKKLNSALNVRGHAAASQGMQDFASQMQKLTGVGDEVTIGLMSQAAEMGFSTGAINDATKAAIGLSEATGKGLEQSLGDVKAALQGNFDAFTGLNPQIMYMRTNQEKLAAVLKIAGQGLHDQSKNMLTVEGSGKRATGAFGDLLESIGAILAPIRVLANAVIEHLSISLQSFLAPAVEYATKAFSRLKGIIDATGAFFRTITESIMNMTKAGFQAASHIIGTVFPESVSDMIDILSDGGAMMDAMTEIVVASMNVIIQAFTFFEVILTNLGSVWDLVVATTELAVINVIESVRYAFTEVIPAYAEWWADNFVNIFETAFSLVFTVVSNHISKIIDALKALWEFIASGGSSDILGDLGAISARSYLEGFESSLTSLPEIAGRKLTEREKELAEKIGAIGSRLGDEFTKKMKERMIGVGDTLGSELSSASDKFNLKGQNNVLMQGINATESRLLTRGPASTFQSQVTDQLGRIANSLADVSQSTGDSKENLDRIKEAAQEERKKINLVPAT